MLKAVRSVNQRAGLLMVTGHGTVETAVEAMRLGADDYILKPLDLFELRDRVQQILLNRAPRCEPHFLETQLNRHSETNRIIGRSLPMQELLEQIAIVAPTRSTVLLLGESGTGKDLIAQTIHEEQSQKGRELLTLELCSPEPNAFGERALRI